MAEYRLAERLKFSKAEFERVTNILRAMIKGVESIRIANEIQDRNGIDYIVELRRGTTINIDLKLRDLGCSRHWKNGPELALEDWSVVEENGHRGKVGWTLDESKQTDYVLLLFQPDDSDMAYLLPFQALRTAFSRNYAHWASIYHDDYQQSESWRSHCIFVPADVVLDAIRDVSTGQYIT